MGRSGAVRCFVTAVIALELLCLQALRVPELEAGLLTTAPLPGRACLPADNLPVAAANLTADELQMLEYLCIVEEAFVHPPIRLETRSGVPEGVACAVTQWCGSGMCTEVCARGSVAVEPWLDNAIRMQTRLSRALPFCFSSMFGTHNSAISLADGYGNLDPVYQDLFRYIKWAGSDFSHAILRTNDQWLSLTDQLNLGVRVVEVDTHWVGVRNFGWGGRSAHVKEIATHLST